MNDEQQVALQAKVIRGAQIEKKKLLERISKLEDVARAAWCVWGDPQWMGARTEMGEALNKLKAYDESRNAEREGADG